MLDRDRARAHRTFEIANVGRLDVEVDRKIGFDLVARNLIPGASVCEVSR